MKQALFLRTCPSTEVASIAMKNKTDRKKETRKERRKKTRKKINQDGKKL